ncbi:MAG: flavin reductase [Treponemataceae bacterium]|nr:flavin reductase [Treponemataceae bacterium]
MMEGFQEADLTDAYKMLKGCETCMIATKGVRDGQYNLTPIGWFMPMDYEPVTKVLFSTDPAHQCGRNILRTKEFALCVPKDPADAFIEQCGSVSAEDADKFQQFGIAGVPAGKIDVLIPAERCAGWIECRLIKILREGSVDLVMGEAAAAFTAMQQD